MAPIIASPANRHFARERSVDASVAVPVRGGAAAVQQRRQVHLLLGRRACDDALLQLVEVLQRHGQRLVERLARRQRLDDLLMRSRGAQLAASAESYSAL